MIEKKKNIKYSSRLIGFIESLPSHFKFELLQYILGMIIQKIVAFGLTDFIDKIKKTD